ncbi:hypothetical protein EBN03_13970 [Nocardia stercoris]|uniref:Uncharacterized protein n=1 Tax=Nocardia stercoris TaxID=2483361 RepID=A0A3M2L5X8_9NOCA|nr:hypothetical protein EBN03_13970 [Nocardia stercoris]
MWTLNLAADLLALMATMDNVPKAKRAAVKDMRIGIDAVLGTRRSWSVIGNAAPGPTALHELRAKVPKRQLVRLFRS